MKALIRLSLLFLPVAFIFSSCQDDDPNPGNSGNPTPPSQYGVYGKVDGVMKTSTTYLGFLEDGAFYAAGDDQSSFAWYVGFYEDIPIGQPVPFDEWQEEAMLSYMDMTTPDEPYYNATSGTITVNLIDTTAHVIKGTFEGTVSNGTSSKVVTNGYFYVPYVY